VKLGFLVGRYWYNEHLSKLTMIMNNSTTEISPCQENCKKNDNSNPQQGTGVRTPSPSVDAKVASMKPNDPSASAKTGSRPDSTTMRSPSTKKDSRKLFVGGLPSDGESTMGYVFLNLLPILDFLLTS